jgi:hypothetical protein
LVKESRTTDSGLGLLEILAIIETLGTPIMLKFALSATFSIRELDFAERCSFMFTLISANYL